MRLKLLTLALALAALPLTGRSEDLLDAYREARANDPVLSQSDATRLSVSEGVPQARALLLPQVNGTVSLNQTSGNGPQSTFNPASGQYDGPLFDSGHIRTRSVSAAVSQSVFDLSKWANLSAAKSQASSQDATYQAALQALYVRVTTAYFGVLTSADQLTFAKANEEALRQAYEQADQRFKVGLSAITDVYQAKSEYEQAKAQTIQAESTLNDSKEALTQITGKPTDDLKKLREDLPMDPPSPADPNVWVQEALKNNPTIAAQQFNVESAEHSINSARAGHLPTVTASVSRGKSDSWAENRNSAAAAAAAADAGTGNGTNGRWGTTIGVTLNVPIFSGGLTQSQVRQSIYNRDSAQDALEIQRRQVTRDTLNFYRTSVAGITQVEAAKAGVDSGQKALEATRAGFDVGTQTMLNVLTAIQTLTQAQSTYSQSRHNFVLNKLQLKQTAGTVDMKDIEEINTLLQ
jgi:outer membrane protein